MRPRIMDHQQIPFVNPRHHTVNGKLIIIFTQRSYYIIFVITFPILFPHHRNVMICAIHCRAHQVYGTGVHTNIFFISMLLMNRLCHKAAIRSHHKAPHFCINRRIAKARRHKHFFKHLAHAFPNYTDIIWLLPRLIRNTNASGKVDKTDIASGCFL